MVIKSLSFFIKQSSSNSLCVLVTVLFSPPLHHFHWNTAKILLNLLSNISCWFRADPESPRPLHKHPSKGCGRLLHVTMQSFCSYFANGIITRRVRISSIITIWHTSSGMSERKRVAWHDRVAWSSYISLACGHVSHSASPIFRWMSLSLSVRWSDRRRREDTPISALFFVVELCFKAARKVRSFFFFFGWSAALWWQHSR